MRRTAVTRGGKPEPFQRHSLAQRCSARRGLHRLARNRAVSRLLTVGVAGAFVLLVGCERTESVQWGFRGNSMIQLYKPSQLAKLQEINKIPPPEPSDPYDPSFPMATEVHQNVQVLTDLNALEFARLMNAISTWVAPVEGCAYCHNPENLASDEKYTKIISREMLKMTRDINTNWQSHVKQTGVTCWTCHRGQGIPSDVWFKAPEPPTPSAGVSGNKGGQNMAGIAINGNSSLPFDPLTPFLEQDYPITVQGTQALPYGNRQSIKQAEWTYSLMMYMSNSLGVNCTYCHQTRAMGVWEESTPQRVTAWHGIRMVRDVNESYLNPLKPLYPAERLGPTGDAPKTACATCHKGTYKPLFGQSMLGDYPSLAGVIPGRLPDETAGEESPSDAGTAEDQVAAAPAESEAPAQEPAAEEQAAPQTAEAEVEQAAAPETEPDQVADSQAGQQAEETPSQAQPLVASPEVESATEEPEAEAAVAAEMPEDAPAATEAAAEPDLAAQPETAAMDATDEALAEAPAKASSVAEQAEPTAGEETAAMPGEAPQTVTPPSAPAMPLAGATQPPSADGMTITEIEAALTRVLDKLHAVRSELEALAPEGPARRIEDEGAADGDAADEAPPESPDRTDGGASVSGESAAVAESAEASMQLAQLGLMAGLQPSAEAGDAGDVERLRAILEAHTSDIEAAKQAALALGEAETRIAQAEEDLEQQRASLAQQLEAVRDQASDAPEASEDSVSRPDYAAALAAAEARLKAAEARLAQERHALQQQLELVRSQRDAAEAEAASRVAREEHVAALSALERRVTAIQARLDQNQHALEQQLVVVRGQRDMAGADAEARIVALRDEHEADLGAMEQRIKAMQVRLDQNRHALEQQLEVVRSQRDEAGAEAQRQLAMLREEHEVALEATQVQIKAMQARLDQNRLALEQQLEVVRAQRDEADARIEERIASLQSDHEAALLGRDQRINAMQARLDQNMEALEQQLEVVRAQRDAADARLEERLAELQREHEATLEALQRRIAAGDVRVRQERLALGQQLDVVREQRDQALAEDAAVALADGQEEAVEQAAGAEGSTPRTALLDEQAADLGGRVTEEGIVVDLGGDELQFETGSAALPQRDLPTLDRTADLLKSRPELTARIEGHTDSLGSAQINQALSQQRAEAVMQALVERGVAASRLTAVGLGAEKPIADNATVQGRSENRRVEIYVIAGEQVAGESKKASG